MANIIVNMSPQDTLALEGYLRERISEGLSALARTRFHPYILETNQANLTPSQSTELLDTRMHLPGIGPFLLRSIQWYSNTARNTLPGTIGANEKRKERFRITNATDKDNLSRALCLAGTFFNYRTASWECPCQYVTDPAAGFRVEVNDDAITVNQDVWFGIHGEIAEGIDRRLFEDIVNMGLVRTTPPAAVVSLMTTSVTATPTEWKYRALRAYLLNKLRTARITPYVLPSSNDNIPQSTTTRMTDDDFRVLRAAFVIKRMSAYFSILTRGELTGTTTNDFADRVDINVLDTVNPDRPYMLNPVMAATLLRFLDDEWTLPVPFVLAPNESLHVDLVEPGLAATTDCYMAYHGYMVQGLNSAETRAALRLGLLE